MTDEEIIRLFFERSEQAIAELSKAHGSAAARVARNILGSERDAEECVNDTYLAVWNAIPPQKPDPLRTFVCKIARNLAATKYHANTAMSWKAVSPPAAAWRRRTTQRSYPSRSTPFSRR